MMPSRLIGTATPVLSRSQSTYEGNRSRAATPKSLPEPSSRSIDGASNPAPAGEDSPGSVSPINRTESPRSAAATAQASPISPAPAMTTSADREGFIGTRASYCSHDGAASCVYFHEQRDRARRAVKPVRDLRVERSVLVWENPECSAPFS